MISQDSRVVEYICRIHQMRGNKNYLDAQADWFRQDCNFRCDHYRAMPKTFQCIISNFPAVAFAE